MADVRKYVNSKECNKEYSTNLAFPSSNIVRVIMERKKINI